MMETLLRGNLARPAPPARPLRGVRAGMSLDSEEARPDEAEIATDLVRRIAAGGGAAEAALAARYSRGGPRRALQPRCALSAAAPGSSTGARGRPASGDLPHRDRAAAAAGAGGPGG